MDGTVVTFKTRNGYSWVSMLPVLPDALQKIFTLSVAGKLIDFLLVPEAEDGLLAYEEMVPGT